MSRPGREARERAVAHAGRGGRDTPSVQRPSPTGLRVLAHLVRCGGEATFGGLLAGFQIATLNALAGAYQGSKPGGRKAHVPVRYIESIYLAGGLEGYRITELGLAALREAGVQVPAHGSMCSALQATHGWPVPS